MSKLILYNGLRADLEAITDINGVKYFKYVRLYNSQFEHQQKEHNDQNAFLFPCALIQLLPDPAIDYLHNNQAYGMTVRIHIGFESYLDEDTRYLQAVQDVYKAIQGKQYAYFSKMLRRDERPNYDYPNVHLYEQDYYVNGKDFDADTRNTLTVLATPVVIGTIIQP